MLTIRSRAVSGPLLRLALVTGAILALYILYLVAVRVSPAEAVFHLVQIDEVMAGAHGNPDIQFVEMRMCCSDQKNQSGDASLVFFNSSGDQTGEFIFHSNPNGGINVSFLIATQAFADLFTTPAPDFIIPPLVQPGSGKVCYKNLTGAGFEVNLCLSYGAFTGDTETDVFDGPAGPPAPSLPIAGAVSLKRVANFGNFETGQFNADFSLTTPEPTNSLGETGPVSIPQTGDLIVTKTASPDPVRVETNLTYTIGVLNNSFAEATGVTVTDTLPLDVNFVSATPGCAGTSTVTCVLGTISSGGRATVTIVVTPTVLGILTNTATVTGDQADPNTGDNAASVTSNVNLAEVEPNDPIAFDQFITIPDSGSVGVEGILGTLGFATIDDLDFYSFHGSVGDVVTIDIDKAIGGLLSFNSMVALFGAGPVFPRLVQNNDAPLDPGSTSSQDSRIENFPLPSTGIFAVGVTNCCRDFQDGGTVLNPKIANGDYTLIISGVTPTIVTGPPSPPALFSPGDGAFLNDNTPLFDWGPSTGDVLRYLLLVTSGDINFGPFDIDVVVFHPTTAFQTLASDAQTDGVHRWRVIAEDTTLLNTTSSVISTFTMDTIPPTRPGNLTEVTTGDGRVREFTWVRSEDPVPATGNPEDESGVHFYNISLIGPPNFLQVVAHAGCNLGPTGDLCRFTTPALLPGPYTINVTAVDRAINQSPTATSNFRVRILSNAVTPESPSVFLGDAQQFTATASLTDGSTADLTSSAAWISSNPMVATIGADGLATAVGIGTADITATSDNISGSTVLTVPDAPLVGHVVLEGDLRPDAGFLVGVTVSFFAPGADPSTDPPLAVRQTTTSLVPVPRMAEFLVPDAPVGTFDVGVSSEHTLTSLVRNVAIGPSGATVNFRNLHEGDADGNGTVDIADFTILLTAYGACAGDVEFDPRVDFDRNGCVGISDFGLLSIHFGEQSPIEVR